MPRYYDAPVTVITGNLYIEV